jgi:trypsin
MSSGSLATVKQEVDLKIVEAECAAYYGSSYDPATMICAGIVGDGKDTCQGDSGGPYIVEENGRAELVGITSWGRGCGDIGVCARTSSYHAWIRDWIQANQ